MVDLTIMQIVGNYGFPMAMCLWFMFRTEKLISTNTDAVQQLSVSIEKIYLQNEKK